MYLCAQKHTKMYLEPFHKTIGQLCQKHHVNSLYVFGSVLTNKFSEHSDIDMIVSFKKIPLENYADNYFDFKFTLEDVLQRPVDLLEEQSVKNPFFLQNLNKNKYLIYG